MVCTISAGTLVSEHVLLAAARAVVGAAAERHPKARKGATRTAGERATGATVDEGYGDDDAAIAAAMDDDERRDEQRSIAAVGGSTEADWTKTSKRRAQRSASSRRRWAKSWSGGTTQHPAFHERSSSSPTLHTCVVFA
jgi:hypothetical protein